MPPFPNPPNPSDPQVNNAGYYKVVLSGLCNTKKIENILWYRVGLDLIPGGWNLFGADTLAEGVYNQVWRGGTRMRDLQWTGYTLVDIKVYPYNDAFAPVYSQPYIRSVNEVGLRPGNLMGQDLTYIIRFNLEATSIFNGFAPPRKGHIKYGPALEGDVPNTGVLDNAFRDFIYDRMVGLAEDIAAPLPIPGSFYPIRVNLGTVLGVTALLGWADIGSITVNPVRSDYNGRKFTV